MAEFMMIPEVYIEEQLQMDKGKNINAVTTLCDEAGDPLNFLQSRATSPGKIKMENIDEAKFMDMEDPLASLDPLSIASDGAFLQVADGFSENNITCELAIIKKSSVCEEYSNPYDSSDSCSEEDASFEEQNKLHIPLCENSMNNVKNEKKRTYECPLCHKCFKTSSAMNGHVAKTHKTTLGEKFVCHVCGAPGSSRASLKRHLIRTHKILNIDHPELLTKKCYHCDIGFATHKMKYEHIRASHGEQLKLYNQCQWCPALMKAKASLVRHVRRAHPGKEHFYSTSVSCYVCNMEMINIPMLQRHMKKEHPDDILHKCNLCTASFKFPYMLTKHKILHQDPDKYFKLRRSRKYAVKCDICSRIFDSKSRLSKHIKNIHSSPLLSEVKVYACKLCDSSFQTAKQNNRHYRRLHRPQRQKIHCGKCNLTFKTPQECNEHRATHPNTCEICQKQFLKRDTLREHLLIHSAPRHQCPHCNKKFTQRSNLKRHIRVHTGEKPFRCSYCSRSFSDKSACSSHARVHTGYERSVCEICGASFSKKQRLNYHMRIHSGEGLLHCPLCPKPSTTSYAFRRHVESHLAPLTKALKSLGLGTLFQSDNSFLQNALQAIIEAVLKGSCEKSSDVNFKKEIDARTLNSIALNDNISLENHKNNLSLFDVDVKNEREDDSLLERCEDSELNNKSDNEKLNIEKLGSDNSTTNFNLAKFLQCILEKESLKIRKHRKLRRRKELDYNEEIYLPINGEECCQSACDKEEELPETVGDELVKQCLEIVMKDESWEENKFNVDEFDNSVFMEANDADCEQNNSTDQDILSESKEMHNSLMISVSEQKTNDIKKECGESDHKQFTDFPNSSTFQKIPKLKISRISCKVDDDLSNGIFIAEVIEKD